MRRILPLLALTALFVMIWPAAAQKPAQAGTGSLEVTCPNGTLIRNGVEIIVNMRPGFTYTATAIGLNGFDPAIAVGDRTGISLCQDDTLDARGYAVNLPTTGSVPSSNLSSQVPFVHNYSGFADISLIVGSVDGSGGEFVLVLEGMAVTQADGSGPGAGDPYSVRLTRNMIDSGVPLTAYMISVSDKLDPYLQMVDASKNVIVSKDGSSIQCDDLSDPSACWQQTYTLDKSNFISTARGRVPLGNYDSAIGLDLSGLTLDPNPANNFFNYLMTSYQQTSFGDYIVVFQMSTGAGIQSGQSIAPTPNTGGKAGAQGGVEVTCPDGTRITNAVEFTVNMRPGFTYTATALGINGFDPIIAVGDRSGISLCQDDAREAITYTANLPSIGFVPNSTTNSQVPFFHDYSGFADISIIVGGLNGSAGEFILILEGMAVTRNDGSGDPFAVQVTPNMIASGVPLSVYMLAVTQDLDPLIALVDIDRNVVRDDQNVPVLCDDAGDSSTCWGQSSSLIGAYVSRTQGRQTPGGQLDSMLNIGISDLTLDRDPSLNYLKFLMTSRDQATVGDYIVIFHTAISAGAKPNA